MRSKTAIKPLTKPQPAPVATPIANAAGTGTPALSAIAVTMPTRVRMAPTERSISPISEQEHHADRHDAEVRGLPRYIEQFVGAQEGVGGQRQQQ